MNVALDYEQLVEVLEQLLACRESIATSVAGGKAASAKDAADEAVLLTRRDLILARIELKKAQS